MTLLMRNSGRFLSFPGGTLDSPLTPWTVLQDNPSSGQPSPLARYKGAKAQPNIYPCKSLKPPDKLRTKILHRIRSTECTPEIPPPSQ